MAAAAGPINPTFAGEFYSHRDAFIGNNITAQPGGTILFNAPGSVAAVKPEIPRKLFTVPYRRDRGFIARPEISRRIHDAVDDGRPAILSGLGGTGKSQIVIDHAHQFRERSQQNYVLWAFCATRESTGKSIWDLAKRLRLPGLEKPQTDVCQLLVDWLNEDSSSTEDSNKSWLLILDNLDSEEVLNEPLMYNQGHTSTEEHSLESKPLLEYLGMLLQQGPNQQILVTTRSHDIARAIDNDSIPVGVFDLVQATQLIQDKLPITSSEADPLAVTRLLEKLGYLPLAITQAAGFMKRNRLSLQAYSAKFDDEDEQLADYLSAELQDSRRLNGWPNSVYRTWKLSFDEIEKSTPLAVDILATISLVGQKSVSSSIFTEFKGAAETNVSMALGTLYSYSLAEATLENHTITVHSLVSACVRYWLREQGTTITHSEQALAAVASTMPWYTWANIEKYTWKQNLFCDLYPLIPSVLRLKVDADHLLRERGNLLSKVAAWESHEGTFRSALDHSREAHKAYLSAKCSTFCDWSESLTQIAANLYNLRDYAEAQDFLEAISAVHSQTLAWKHLLVRALIAQGKTSQAETLCREALELCQEKDAMTRIHLQVRLAYILRQQRQLAEAKTLFKVAIHDVQKQFPNAKDEYLQACRGLGWVHVLEGDLTKAQAWFTDLRNKFKHDSDIPKTQHMWMTLDLARCLRYKREYTSAATILKNLIHEGTSILGEDSPDVQQWRDELRATEASLHSDPLPQGWIMTPYEANPERMGYTNFMTGEFVLHDPRERQAFGRGRRWIVRDTGNQVIWPGRQIKWAQSPMRFHHSDNSEHEDDDI